MGGGAAFFAPGFKAGEFGERAFGAVFLIAGTDYAPIRRNYMHV
jgi:hypothetical protein